MTKELFYKVKKAALASGRLYSSNRTDFAVRHNYCVLGILCRVEFGNWKLQRFPKFKYVYNAFAGTLPDGSFRTLANVERANDNGKFETAFNLAFEIFTHRTI